MRSGKGACTQWETCEKLARASAHLEPMDERELARPHRIIALQLRVQVGRSGLSLGLPLKVRQDACCPVATSAVAFSPGGVKVLTDVRNLVTHSDDRFTELEWRHVQTFGPGFDLVSLYSAVRGAARCGRIN